MSQTDDDAVVGQLLVNWSVGQEPGYILDSGSPTFSNHGHESFPRNVGEFEGQL